MNIKKFDKKDSLDGIKDYLSNPSSMDDGTLRLLFDSIKSKQLAKTESNLASAVNDRTNSIQRFIDIAFQLATFEDRVNFEKAYLLHQIMMMGHTERDKFLELVKKEIENKMLGMEYELTALDYKMKRAIMLKVRNDDD
jgi:hypothetical protein